MKNTALQFLIHAGKTVVRFPLVWLVALIGSFVATLALGDQIPESKTQWIIQWTQTLSLGIPLFLASTLWAERIPKIWSKWVIQITAIIILVFIYFHLKSSHQYFNQGELTIHFFGYSLCLHLLVSFLPLYKSLNSQAFWHYNKTLFLRAAITGLYTIVLYAGLSGAILAFQELLGFNISGITYAKLWFYLAGIGSVWIFLAGIPERIEDTVETGYPKGLQVFAQYILLPLVLLYLLILYVYVIKIMAIWSLPIGWVSNLILAFSIVGMLALLLLHPLSDDANNKWINRFTRLFYFAILPLLVLLFIAAFTRIKAYGFTELRYALLCLAIWLTVVSVLMILNRNKKIYIVPVSLFIAAFWVFFMPQFNLSTVARNSQQERLIQILKSHDMWDHGIKKPAKDLDDSTSTEILEISKYLMSTHGITGMEPKVVIPKEMRNGSGFWETQEWIVGEMYRWGVNSVKFNQIYGETIVTTTDTTDTIDVKNIVPPDIFIKNNIPYFGFYKFPSYGLLPTGKWNGFMDFDYEDGNTSTETESSLAKIDFENTNGTITVLVKTPGKQKDKYLIDSLMKNQISVLTNPKPKAITNYNFKNSSPGKIYTLYGKSSAMQVFSIKYHWNKGTKQYEMVQINGRFWLH